MFGSHHPSLTLETILFLMRGCQEAMHPVPIIALFDLMFDHWFDHWLVCESVRDLVYLLDCSLVAVVKSND
jgi:hypothetical protein